MENTPGLTTPSSLLWATWSFCGPSLSAVFFPLCTDLLGSLLTSLNVASIWPGHFSHHRSVSQLLPLTLSSFCASYLWKTPSRSTLILILFCFQFSSVAQSCPTLCDPMNRSMPGLPVHHQLPEFTQTHVHQVSDAIQPSHPLSSVPFSSCPQSLPASKSFPMSQLFA